MKNTYRSMILAAVLGIVPLAFGNKVLFDGDQNPLPNTQTRLDPENTDTDNRVASWTPGEKMRDLTIVPDDKDWSRFSGISLRIHVNEVESHELVVICDSNPEGATDYNYFFTKIPIDWKGWKTVVIPFESFTKARSPAGWNKITCLKIQNYGWGSEPNPDAKYDFDDVTLLDAVENTK